MKFKKRYKYWQVLVGIICIGIGGYFIYNLVYGFNPPKTEHGPKNPDAYPDSGWRMFHDFFYYVTLFYFSLNFLYNLISTRKKFFSYLQFVVLFFLAICLYKSLLYYCIPTALHNRYDNPFPIYLITLQGYFPFLLISFLFAYFTYVRELLKQKRILEAQKLQLEAQISQANFNFLKAQINPHFLHNTLNFLYSKSLPYSPELSEGILTLSDIMRYALSKGNQKDGKAPLKDEIEHVHNVIKISQLRFSNQLNVKFEVTGTVNEAQIVPFVLITLVENAFMHGDLKDPEYPIDIRLDVKDKQLYFRCRNKKRFGPKQQSTGIGLDNMKKRLDLAYGNKYNITVKDEAEFYTTELTIYEL